MAITAFTGNVSLTAAAPGNTEQKAKPTPEERAKLEVKNMTALLALSADQASKVTAAAVQKYKDQIAIRKKHNGDQEAIRSEGKKVQEQYAAQLKQILSPEQYAKLKAHKAEMHRKHKKGGEARKKK